MRVVVLNDFGYVEGGASRVAITSAQALARRGHKVTFFTGVGTESPFDPAVEFVTAAGQSTRSNPNRVQAAAQGLWNPSSGRLLDEFLATCPPDTIFHLHTWTKALSNSVLHRLAARREHVVLTVHEYFSMCPNGCYYNHAQQRMCRLRPLSPACIASNCDARSYPEKLWRVGRHAIQRHIVRFPLWCRHVITLSELSSGRVQPYLHPEAHVYRVPNPVERPATSRIDPVRNSRYLMIGRLAGEKGPDLFAAAARRCGITPRFVGEGPDRSRVLAASPDAQILGWVEPQQVAGELSRARVVVFPSRWDETAGLAVLEAATAGIPSIVSDGCAAAEFAGDDERGLRFAAGSIESLAQKLAQIRDDDDLLDRLSRAAFQAAPAWAPTPDGHAALLEDVYHQVLQRPSAYE